MTTASDIKTDARELGNTALEAARDQVIDPARAAAAKAGKLAQEVYADTRDAVVKHAGEASEMAKVQCDRAITWARANPLTAIGIAFAAGLLFAKSTLSSNR
jgi:ElaB/YqjD/DUF883 family membrane-anchored ribosome-binding protein